VEVAGVYHTAALFFDRINRLPRIITVSGLKMGSPRMEQGRFISQTTFDLIAYAAPQEKPVSGTAQPVPASKVAQAGK
jgi:type IV pilus assembly protein PilO